MNDQIASPPADPFPALVDHLRAWVAQHADKFSRGYFLPSPGHLGLTLVRPMPQPNPEFNPAILDITSELAVSILQDDRFFPTIGRYSFDVSYTYPEYPIPPAAIPLDSPDAPALIADRIRTAEELRAELARMAKERDAANSLDHAVSVIRDALAEMGYDERCALVHDRIMAGYCHRCGSGVLPCYCGPQYDM